MAILNLVRRLPRRAKDALLAATQLICSCGERAVYNRRIPVINVQHKPSSKVLHHDRMPHEVEVPGTPPFSRGDRRRNARGAAATRIFVIPKECHVQPRNTCVQYLVYAWNPPAARCCTFPKLQLPLPCGRENNVEFLPPSPSSTHVPQTALTHRPRHAHGIIRANFPTHLLTD